MVRLIAAVASNGCIGKGNSIPWKFPIDMQWFKSRTIGYPVIMGSRTFHSFKRPLPNRKNIVLSRHFASSDCVSVQSMEDALVEAKKVSQDCFVIGGAAIYKLFLPIVQEMIITHISKDYDGDVFFPEWPLSDAWEEQQKLMVPQPDGVILSFCTYKRRD